MEISVQDLDRMRKEGEAHTLLDIREDDEIAICTIEGYEHIAMNTIPENLDKLSKDHPLVVYCHMGGRSYQVTAWLRQNGFDNAVSLAGGISSWSAEIDSSVPRY